MPFYAVRNGRQNGVYTSWSECESQVKGFRAASFKKFNTAQEAQNFVDSAPSMNNSSAGILNQSSFAGGSSDVSSYGGGRYNTSSYGGGSFNTSSYGGGNRSQSSFAELSNGHDSTFERPSATSGASGSSDVCYAVRKGRKPGVYSTWAECQQQISGFPYASFRKFKSRQDADEFVASSSTKSFASSNSSVNVPSGGSSSNVSDPPLVVYTDGGCFNNGKKGASAGYGVWWGVGHPWNESRRLRGQQTNNRAEIEAAISAVQRADREKIKHLEIRTDSNFLISCISGWINKWKNNGWILADGKPVKVREPIERLDNLLNESGVKVTWTHVAGHAGIKGNEEADKLARQGSLMPYGPIFDSDDDFF